MKPGKEQQSRPISIWQPRQVDGETVFARPAPLPLGDHYADRTSFSRKKTPGLSRICFFGESAAAGYLYAPHATPAKMLEHLLLEICGKPEFEVIDLARTNETIDGLVDKVESAAQLHPDVIVIFTGNNWTMTETPELSPYYPSAGARRELAQLLREEGWTGVIDTANRRIAEKAAAAYARIDQVAREVEARVLIVVPEVNLADWENRQAPTWLPGNGTAQWYSAYKKATEALQNEDWLGAEAAAWQMEDLDGCTCPTTYRLLAKAFLEQGETAKAAAACRAEVDSNRYPSLCFLGAPQINTGFRRLQQKAAAHHGFALVDLADIFAQYSGSPLPGRRLFLDYCHLSLEGMKVAMTPVAVEVLRKTNHLKKDCHWETLVNQLPYPTITPEADATAKFGAAIHTAHRHLAIGNEQEILDYWCKQALETSPGIRQVMLDFLEMRMAPLPAVLTEAQQRNFDSSYRLQMQHGVKYDYPDVLLCGVIANILEVPWPDKAHCHTAHPSYLLWNPVAQFYPELMSFRDLPRRAFYRAAWPESRFVLLCPPGKHMQLQVTLRLPAIPGWEGKRNGTVIIRINGRETGKLALNEQWTTASFPFELPAPAPVLQQLTIIWPALPPCGDEALAMAIHRLEQGWEADLHPVFGEVFGVK